MICLKNIAVNSDVLKLLPHVEDQSIHLTFTSPPYYNAKEYSYYSSYTCYLNFLEEVFIHIHRITKEGRFLVINTSPVIVPRLKRSDQSKRYAIPFDLHTVLSKIGWDFIDDIIWLKPESSSKNRIGNFNQHRNRNPLAYKPNLVTEYIMVYRKHTDNLIDWNIRGYDRKILENSKIDSGYETSNVWRISPKSNKNHPAIFPEELCKRVVQYYSFKEDLVFDPFAGSGTVGTVAKSLDRFFFLVEQNKTYFNYMRDRLRSGLFDAQKSKFLTLDEFS